MAQSWAGWNADLPSSLQGIDELVSGRTYFILTSGDSDWTYPPGGDGVPDRVPLFAGENAIVYGGATQSVVAALGDAAPAVRAILRFDAASQGWEAWNPLLPGALQAFDELTTSEAYWVVATTSVTWTMTAAAPESDTEPTVVFVPSEGAGGGNVAVELTPPSTPRYAEGAPVVLIVNSFIGTPDQQFDDSLSAVTSMGFVHAAFLWPGVGVGANRSDGVLDNGGEQSIQALRDVARFVSGAIPDAEGRLIGEVLAVPVLTENVGLYAFSNPGIAAVNALALYGADLPNVRYFVGRENPTSDTTTAVEVGHWEGTTPVLNPSYTYPADYSPTALSPDYSLALYDPGLELPYFDVNGSGGLEPGIDFSLGERVPSLLGKRCYSAAMTLALRDNGSLTDAAWPSDLCTPEEAAELWAFRATPARYPLLAVRPADLAVMLIFAKRDHVQPAPDGPHIHQAFDGFSAAGLWLRLNPDRSYVEWVDATFTGFPDNPANSEPSDWRALIDWATPDVPEHALAVSLAAIAEMSDRVRTSTWTANLSDVIVAAPRAELGTP